MLSAIKWFVKIVVFAALVLVLGSVVHWRGKTVSDQIKTHLSHAENIKVWTKEVTKQVTKEVTDEAAKDSADEDIPPSERQKLKALIRELNSSHGQD